MGHPTWQERQTDHKLGLGLSNTVSIKLPSAKLSKALYAFLSWETKTLVCQSDIGGKD